MAESYLKLTYNQIGEIAYINLIRARLSWQVIHSRTDVGGYCLGIPVSNAPGNGAIVPTVIGYFSQLALSH